ncbi:MAG: hypothetical protein FWF02_02725 [Micrococcales bacterium]|nr:hypothetical protein [Micrococcales bacterium]MCL2666603.1 hypothetical protein [Micrococcales bacterium]
MRDKNSVDGQLVAVRKIPYGTTRTVAAERLVAQIEAEGPQACLAFAYLVLVEAYAHGGEGRKVLVPYTKVLRLADQSPDLLDEYDAHTLLWAAKWVVNEVIETPQVPVERVDALLVDMERRFVVAGAGLDAIWYLRTVWADERDDPSVQSVYETWVATPRDDFSQCSVCDPGDRAGYLYGWGRTEEAVRIIEQTLVEGERCLSEPADMLSRAALAYLDLGRTDEAVVAHRRTLAELDRAEVPLVGVRGKVLRFLARVGAHDAVVRRISDDEQVMLAQGESAGYRMGAFVALGSAASCVAATDPDRELRSLASGTTTVAGYAAWCRAQADQIAATFDARYGDDHVSRRIASAWELSVVPVDLSVLSTPDPDSPPAVDRVEVLSGSDGRSQPAVAWETEISSTSLVEQAEEASSRGDLAQAAPKYQQAGRDLVEAGMLVDAGFAFAEAAHCAQVLEDHDGAHTAFARAVDLLAAGGAEPALVAPVVRAWTATACAVGDAEAALDRLASTATTLVTEAVADDRSAGAVPVRPQVARARRHEAAAVADVRARTLATLGRWDEAVTSGSQAADVLEELGSWAAAGQASWLVGRLLARRGDAGAAAGRYRTAAAQLGRAHQRDTQVKVLDDLVALLRGAGLHDEADEIVTDLLG